jgi:hypothetical protein
MQMIKLLFQIKNKSNSTGFYRSSTNTLTKPSYIWLNTIIVKLIKVYFLFRFLFFLSTIIVAQTPSELITTQFVSVLNSNGDP